MSGVARVSPHGVRVVYRAEDTLLREAFESIAEQMGRYVVELPFEEQGRDGLIRVEPMQIGTLGEEHVAVRVRDVGPDSSGPGWTADYYWIGFVRDGDRLVSVKLNEAWRDGGAENWPDDYPQPTISDGELRTQSTAALADAE